MAKRLAAEPSGSGTFRPRPNGHLGDRGGRSPRWQRGSVTLVTEELSTELAKELITRGPRFARTRTRHKVTADRKPARRAA